MGILTDALRDISYVVCGVDHGIRYNDGPRPRLSPVLVPLHFSAPQPHLVKLAQDPNAMSVPLELTQCIFSTIWLFTHHNRFELDSRPAEQAVIALLYEVLLPLQLFPTNLTLDAGF